MSVIITATVKTVYQFNSLLELGIGFKKNLDGSFSSSKEFDSVEEARKFLKNRADIYYEKNDIDVQQLKDMHEQIDKFDCLTIDAATAQIRIK